MKVKFTILILCVAICYSCTSAKSTPEENQVSKALVNPARELIMRVVKKTGSMEKLRNLKDVEYKYTFESLSNQAKDISTERYVFDGELSYAAYDTHEVFIMPGTSGKVLQKFNGDSTLVSLEGQPVTDKLHIGTAGFVRKANFYWFAMMQKLLDEGIKYELMPDQEINENIYKRVKMSFDKGVGDVQDDFVLYVNPETLLIDQFLFTVKKSPKFPVPMLMEAKYEQVDGVYLMTDRKVIQADWDGNKIGDYLFSQVSENIKFNNNFNRKTFEIE